MQKLLNLTPHAIHIFSADGKTELVTVPPSGVVARVAVTRQEIGTINGVPVFVSAYGEVEGLPQQDTSLDKIDIIVSAMVRQAVPYRHDVYSPGELIRDEKGQPIGCKGLEANR